MLWPKKQTITMRVGERLTQNDLAEWRRRCRRMIYIATPLVIISALLMLISALAHLWVVAGVNAIAFVLNMRTLVLALRLRKNIALAAKALTQVSFRVILKE